MNRTILKQTLLILAVLMATMPVQANNRISNGVLAEYHFTTGSRHIIRDVSSNGHPLDLYIQNLQHTRWLQCGGLSIDKPTIITAIDTNLSANKLYKAITASNAISIEAWIKPAAEQQHEQEATIITLSKTARQRNFALLQAQKKYTVRLRTTSTRKNGSKTSTIPSKHRIKNKLTHILYTRNAAGKVDLYINAELIANQHIPGNLSNWKSNFDFALANRLSGDRPWLGHYYLVAIYDRALDQNEIRQNYTAGFARDFCKINNNNKPVITSTPVTTALIPSTNIKSLQAISMVIF